MTQDNRDLQRLIHVLEYCRKIKIAAAVFDDNYEKFLDDKNYPARDLCSFYILQIGELVGGLSDDFRNANQNIPWRAIKGMRNVVVHKYGSIDLETLWEVLSIDLPKLECDCRDILNSQW